VRYLDTCWTSPSRLIPKLPLGYEPCHAESSSTAAVRAKRRRSNAVPSVHRDDGHPYCVGTALQAIERHCVPTDDETSMTVMKRFETLLNSFPGIPSASDFGHLEKWVNKTAEQWNRLSPYNDQLLPALPRFLQMLDHQLKSRKMVNVDKIDWGGATSRLISTRTSSGLPRRTSPSTCPPSLPSQAASSRPLPRSPWQGLLEALGAPVGIRKTVEYQPVGIVRDVNNEEVLGLDQIASHAQVRIEVFLRGTRRA